MTPPDMAGDTAPGLQPLKPPAIAGYTFSGFTLDLRRQALLMGGHEVKLRPRTFDVLTYLVLHSGTVVSKADLFAAVWGEVAVTDDSLVQCLVEIRRALGGAVRVRTIRGRGYILEAEVKPLAHGNASVFTEPVATPPPKAGSGRNLGAVAVLGVLLTLVVAALLALAPWRANGDGAPGVRSAVAPPPPRPETDNQEAYAEYLAGRQALLRRTRGGLRTAVGHFEKAIALDPEYAMAHAGLARALTLVGVLGAVPPLEIYPRARDAALRAVELDTTLADAHVALAHLKVQYDWDWPGAEASYGRAIALNPRLGDAHGLFAFALAVQGRWDEAFRAITVAQQVDASAPWSGTEGILRFLARDYDRARSSLEGVVTANPADTMAQFWLSLTHVAAGRLDEALAAAIASGAEVGNAPTWVLAWIHVRAGRVEAAREVKLALDERARSSYVPAVDQALLALAFDDREEAIRLLTRGLEERSHWMDLLGVHPFVDSLRGDPRFHQILARMRLPQPPHGQ